MEPIFDCSLQLFWQQMKLYSLYRTKEVSANERTERLSDPLIMTRQWCSPPQFWSHKHLLQITSQKLDVGLLTFSDGCKWTGKASLNTERGEDKIQKGKRQQERGGRGPSWENRKALHLNVKHLFKMAKADALNTHSDITLTFFILTSFNFQCVKVHNCIVCTLSQLCWREGEKGSSGARWGTACHTRPPAPGSR